VFYYIGLGWAQAPGDTLDLRVGGLIFCPSDAAAELHDDVVRIARIRLMVQTDRRFAVIVTGFAG